MSLCLQVSGIMSNTWKITSLHYASGLHCQPQIGQLGCAHNLFVSRVATLCMHAHHMTACLITCEWQSFFGVTMLVTERLLLVSEVTLFDTVAEPVSECSANSYSYFNIIISMLNLPPSALQILTVI